MDLETFLIAVYCLTDDTLRHVLHGIRLRERLRARGVHLIAPFQTRKYEEAPWPRWLVHTRRRIEVVLAQLVDAQLVERYRSKRTWARDLWHSCSRWLRKVLSHTTAVLLCQRQGLGTLSFSQLVSA